MDRTALGTLETAIKKGDEKSARLAIEHGNINNRGYSRALAMSPTRAILDLILSAPELDITQIDLSVLPTNVLWRLWEHAMATDYEFRTLFVRASQLSGSTEEDIKSLATTHNLIGSLLREIMFKHLTYERALDWLVSESERADVSTRDLVGRAAAGVLGQIRTAHVSPMFTALHGFLLYANAHGDKQAVLNTLERDRASEEDIECAAMLLGSLV